VTPRPLWRVFPWDPDAAEGERFSAAFVPGGQGGNRFDLRRKPHGVIYLSEAEDHAVAEMIQGFRNSPEPLTNDDLTSWGRTLAVVSADLDEAVWAGIADLCQPSTLASLGITADVPAMRRRMATQDVASDLYSRGYTGLRWWSAFWGEWHSVVLFRENLPDGALRYGKPVALDVTNPAVAEAARRLDIG
jgi:hypothetical protein